MKASRCYGWRSFCGAVRARAERSIGGKHHVPQHYQRSAKISCPMDALANRCLWTSVYRSVCLPSGSALAHHELAPITQQLRQALDWAATTDRVLIRDQAAESLWEECYPDLRGCGKIRCRGRKAYLRG